MSTIIYPKYQIPFFQFIFECLAVLTYTVALFPGGFLRVFFITIPVLITSLVLTRIQESELFKYSLLNILVSFLLLYSSYNSLFDMTESRVFVFMSTLLTLTGISISIYAIVTIAKDVHKHYTINKKFDKESTAKSTVETVKPIFSTKKRKKSK